MEVKVKNVGRSQATIVWEIGWHGLGGGLELACVGLVKLNFKFSRIL